MKRARVAAEAEAAELVATAAAGAAMAVVAAATVVAEEDTAAAAVVVVADAAITAVAVAADAKRPNEFAIFENAPGNRGVFCVVRRKSQPACGRLANLFMTAQ